MSLDDDPYGDDPVLSALPREARQRIADQIAQGKRLAAMNTLRMAVGGGFANPELKRAYEAFGSYGTAGKTAEEEQPLKLTLASGKIDNGGTTLALYKDGTFTTTGLFRTSEPERLIAFTSDVDSMRRKSVTGRGAAWFATGGMSMLASNNRGVIYVTITGAISGTKTYTTKNPEDNFLSTIRTLQSAADQLLASQPLPASAGLNPSPSQQGSDVATQLKMLAELHASGALSDDEFVAAKARLLS